MGLRFTDTNKWRDPWFMDLSVTLKCLWQYVCDNCDNAGVWSVNRKLAEFEIGTSIDWDDALSVMRDRVVAIDDGRKWHLTKFVAFQNPGGLGDSHPHRQILRLLESHGLSNPIDRVGGRLPGGYKVASKTRPDQTSPDKGGVGGAGPVDTSLLLAEFALPNGPRDVAEWKSGLKLEAKCRSADEARAFIRWAVEVCRQQNVRAQHYRHVRRLAVEWDEGQRAIHWNAA